MIKLFWFQAILDHVCKGQQEISFEELIDDMIANAWYMVTEYHLNLGPRDKLEKVKKYWKLFSELAPIHEIYGENRLAPENISIDHFVPWSYVAHDEFWNLHPTTRVINSSKSNRLPEWELYFPRVSGGWGNVV